MRRSLCRRPLMVSAATLLGLSLGIACAATPEEKKPSAAPSPDAVARSTIVPGADLFCTVDLAAWRTAPLWQTLRGKDQASNASVTRMETITGLKEADVLSVAFSADLDAWNLDAEPYEQIRLVDAAGGIRLAKPLTFETLKKAIEELKSNSLGTKVEALSLAGRDVVRVTPTSAKEPVVYAALAADGRMVYVSFKESSMAGTIKRELSKRAESLNPALRQLGTRIPAAAQFRLSMLASDAMRQRLTEKFEAMRGPNPQAAQNQMAMMLTFIGPIHTLKNLALGIRTTEEAEVTLAGELNSETDAQQCAHLMQTFIIPMVQKAVETAGKADAMRVDDSLSIRSEAAALLVRFAIGMGDINAMRGMGQAAGRPKSAAPTAVAPEAETAPADEPAAE